MAIVTKATLKTYFEQGDIPTQGQYVDLIDSNLNLGESETTQIIQGTISASAAIVGYVELKKMYIPGIGVGSATVGTTFTVGRSLEVIGDINTTGNISASGYLVVQNITASSNISASGTIKGQSILATSNMGYTTGAGGTVTQLTSRTTAVTINKMCGSIRLALGVGSSTFQTFNVSNSLVEETDVVVVSQKSGTDIYQVIVTKITEGEFRISCATTGITLESPVINFAIIKAVTS